jgi:branched-chain amino acid transport system permease protein
VKRVVGVRRVLGVVAVIAVIAVVVAPPLWLSVLRLGTATELLAYAVAVLSVNLIVGHTGQIALGHAAFVGVGAYVTVVLSGDHGWPMVLTVPVAAVFAFVVGVLLAIPALRLSGLYLALITLAVGAAFGPVVKRLSTVTGGTGGKSTRAVLDAPSWFGSGRLADARWIYAITAAIAFVVFVCSTNLVSGRIGRSLVALREHELSARTFGINVQRQKVVMFGISAGVAAIAGSLFMFRERFAIDTTYSPQLSIRLYTAAFIGGVSSIRGALIGGVVIVLTPVVFDAFGVLLEPNLVFGATLVVLTLFAPDGMAGWVARFQARRDAPNGSADFGH